MSRKEVAPLVPSEEVERAGVGGVAEVLGRRQWPDSGKKSLWDLDF